LLNKNVSIFEIELRSSIKSNEFYESFIALPDNSIVAEKQNNQKVNIDSINLQDAETQSADRSIDGDLSNKEKAILTLIGQSESLVMPEPEIRNVLKIKSGSSIHKIKSRLQNFGYINIHKIQRKKGYFSAWELTAAGSEIAGLNVPAIHSKGGSLHRFLVYQVRNYLNATGWQTEIEAALNNGKQVDILARNDSKVFCYEIGLPPLDKELGNCRKIFASSLSPNEVIHLVLNGRDKSKLNNALKQHELFDNFREKITVDLAGNFVTWD